mmetsp:Transcript_115692/g.322305  ORF Transcript_115692/g.322305 Transcript_115692/m.322305 type:complete len:109 (-) Transcript_115692:73-399(-)
MQELFGFLLQLGFALASLVPSISTGGSTDGRDMSSIVCCRGPEDMENKFKVKLGLEKEASRSCTSPSQKFTSQQFCNADEVGEDINLGPHAPPRVMRHLLLLTFLATC